MYDIKETKGKETLGKRNQRVKCRSSCWSPRDAQRSQGEGMPRSESLGATVEVAVMWEREK